MRPEALSRLLDSVMTQTQVPNQILIIDGSVNQSTALRFRESDIPQLQYHQVPPEYRGLTKQRNYGIEKVTDDIDIVAFLDDDTILSTHYFEQLLDTYTKYPKAFGVGGYITNEVAWERVNQEKQDDFDHFYFDGYRRKESSRYKLRRRLGLTQNTPPAVYPTFGHGRSVSFLPPSGKIYKVDQLMGGVSSFPIAVLREHKFSEYFEGYGLYEDADFTLRLSKIGDLYVNTAAQLEHHHEDAGRPNQFAYGKMVVRNGWYVWRVKFPDPDLKDQIKWYLITIILCAVRFINIFTTSKKKESFTEVMGRVVGILSLLFNRPKIESDGPSI